ncbi:MAG: hypothetical protein FD167_258 [bacterium]|nr:MAG: hypothetical protein FD167_258 [bacterium]
MENKDINAITDANKNFNQYATDLDFNKSLTLLNAFESQKASKASNASNLTNTENTENTEKPLDVIPSKLNVKEALNTLNTIDNQELSPITATSDNVQEATPLINEQESSSEQESSQSSSSSLTSDLASDPNPTKTSNSVIIEQLNNVESFLRSIINRLNNKQRKLLGYSMMGIGIILSTLLIVNTFNKLEFSNAFVSPSSKEAVTNLLTKAATVSSQSKAKENSRGDETNTNNNLSDSGSSSDVANSPNSNTGNADTLANWQPITRLLASTEKKRTQAAKDLGIDKGEWILACVSVGCWDCDRAALTLNKLKINNKVSNLLAITTANQTEATLWKERLGLEIEVRSVSSEAFGDTGAVFLPTIIKLKDGVSIGAKESLEGK